MAHPVRCILTVGAAWKGNKRHGKPRTVSLTENSSHAAQMHSEQSLHYHALTSLNISVRLVVFSSDGKFELGFKLFHFEYLR